MKLLLAADEYLPHPGGGPRVILETSWRLQARGHSVAILTFERNSSLPRWDHVADIPVHRIRLRGKLSTYPRALLNGQRAFHEQMRDGAYDLLHIHQPLIGPGALMTSDARRVPRIYSFYGPWYREMGTELRVKPLPPLVRALYGLYVGLLCQGLKWWQGQVMRRCDRIIVLSQHSRQQVAALFPGINQDQIVLIAGGVDIERFHPVPDQSPVRAHLGLPSDRTILLTVRRLVPRMGLENLLHAFAQVIREQRDLYLVIGGRGWLEDALRTLAGRLGITDRVRFTGFILEEDLPVYYQAADLFVLPTLALEGFGLTTLEALASGLPVVGTPVGSIPEILGRFDARFLTSGTDAAALAEGIRRGLALVRGQGTALTERCRAFAVAHYDWERIVDRYEALYAELSEEVRGP
jgi:glycosyltransferase involved in cell wall biosynthesis